MLLDCIRSSKQKQCDEFHIAFFKAFKCFLKYLCKRIKQCSVVISSYFMEMIFIYLTSRVRLQLTLILPWNTSWHDGNNYLPFYTLLIPFDKVRVTLSLLLVSSHRCAHETTWKKTLPTWPCLQYSNEVKEHTWNIKESIKHVSMLPCKFVLFIFDSICNLEIL